ncbi:MAG: cofactor-independent phosphoglycerate mutase [Oscillospiraceae bacterium]|nr:cofactor-independent phosphoglycerate mutase [Oscillospiraceae bacterium]
MKCLVILGDGMADRPIPQLQNKTPLEYAYKPNMDFLASHGCVGCAKTIPDGMTPGSDTANLAVMGYDPKKYYSGRSPLEAVSMGISLENDDVTFRCNLVTVSDEENLEDATMIDYSSDEITTPESTELINFLAKEFNSDTCALYPGISYRHCFVLKHALTGTVLTPPHDILEKPVRSHLPSGRYGDLLLDIMKRSRVLLEDHPVNKDRIARGLRPANCCWFWGEGVKPKLDSFYSLYHAKGGVISAVDLIKGIGKCAGLEVAEVPGATGTLASNYKGKASAAIDLFSKGCDMVYVHMEAPDEYGHRGEYENKVKAIEVIDKDVVGPILKELRKSGEDFSVLLMPDHPTPIEIRTHCSDKVPFVLYRSGRRSSLSTPRYTESLAETTGLYVPDASILMSALMGKTELYR